ncbi:MAG TPA: hypothetical protein VMV79_00210 [Alphaproteobacteria bacterium]|nr:hypothetical protein [Alphaproteobacteria bacterium]
MQHAPRHPNRRDKKATQARKAVAVLFILSLVVAAVGYAYLTGQAALRPLDPKTFCPTDAEGPSSVTAILIDRTDTFSLVQQAAIRERLNELKDQTPRYGLIEVYAVEPTQQKLLQPEFTMCNPGKGENISKWTGNPHLVEERWQKLFATPLQSLFDTILGGGTANISPIMESIQSIAVTSLGTPELAAKNIPRRLIIISDLLQYVKDYSQYRPLGNFAQFKTTPYYQSVRADLSGVSVAFWYVRRQKTLPLQGEKHLAFWRAYIADQGGTVDKVWDVPGL